MKKWIALVLALVMVLGMVGCGGSKKSESVIEVENLINSISEITIDNFEEATASVNAAKNAYDELSSDEKEKVENYTILTEAIEHLAKVKKEVDEKIYQDELYSLANEILKISYDCRDISSVIISIWKYYGASYFSIGFDAVRIFQSDWTRAEYTTFLKRDISKTLYNIAEVLWPNMVQNKSSLTEDEQEKVIDLLYDFNNKFSNLEKNMDTVSELVREFRAKYKDMHPDEVSTLNDWCIECSLYVDFALNPSGNLNSYTSTREEYQNSMSKFAKRMDAYY